MAKVSSVESILFAVLEKETPEQRAACLVEACGDDTDLREQVERLLRAQEQAGSFLEFPLRPDPATIDDPFSEMSSATTRN